MKISTTVNGVVSLSRFWLWRSEEGRWGKRENETAGCVVVSFGKGVEETKAREQITCYSGCETATATHNIFS